MIHHVEILASSECGGCRHATDLVTEYVASHGGANYEVHAIDVSRHPDAARRASGQAHAPLVLIDGRVALEGHTPELAALEALLH